MIVFFAWLGFLFEFSNIILFFCIFCNRIFVYYFISIFQLFFFVFLLVFNKSVPRLICSISAMSVFLSPSLADNFILLLASIPGNSGLGPPSFRIKFGVLFGLLVLLPAHAERFILIVFLFSFSLF